MRTQERYTAHLSLPEIGEVGQQRLAAAKVLVVGAGGLGCPALSYLAAAGVGCLGVIDFDRVQLSNLPRQLLFNANDLDKNKAVVAAEKLRLLNPEVELKAYLEKLTPANAVEVAKSYDLLLDCSDDLPTRYLINDVCVQLGLPFVYAGIHRFEGQLAVFNYKGGPDYRSLYPQAVAAEGALSCSAVGVLGTVPGILGTWQANEALKLLAGNAQVLSDELLLIHLKTNEVRKVQLPNRKQRVNVLPTETEELEVQASWVKRKLDQGNDSIQLIDIREWEERNETTDLESEHLPLSDWKAGIDQVDSTKDVVLFCQTGKRSRGLVPLMRSALNRSNIVSLSGGIQAWEATFIKQTTHD
jgi:adenylyltransferase/sulfurtransferase